MRSKIRFDEGSLKPSCHGIPGLQTGLFKVHGCLHCAFSNFFPRQVSGRVVAFVSAAHGRSCPRVRRLDRGFSFRGVGGDIHHDSNGLGSCGPRGSLVWIRPQRQVPGDSLPITVSTPLLLFNKSYWQAIKPAIHFLSPLILHSGWHECRQPSRLSQGQKWPGSTQFIKRPQLHSHLYDFASQPNVRVRESREGPTPGIKPSTFLLRGNSVNHCVSRNEIIKKECKL